MKNDQESSDEEDHEQGNSDPENEDNNFQIDFAEFFIFDHENGCIMIWNLVCIFFCVISSYYYALVAAFGTHNIYITIIFEAIFTFPRLQVVDPKPGKNTKSFI